MKVMIVKEVMKGDVSPVAMFFIIDKSLSCTGLDLYDSAEVEGWTEDSKFVSANFFQHSLKLCNTDVKKPCLLAQFIIT